MKLSNLIWIIGLVFLIGCSKEHGTLEGKLTIGPLCPVESPDDSKCQPTAKTYKAWSISVYDESGHFLSVATSDESGNFRMQLEPGRYIVDADSNRNLKDSGKYRFKVNIKANQTTSVKIEIDTGIR